MPKRKYALSDEMWARIQPYIPTRKNTHPRGGGRKPKDDRLVFEAILFVLRFDCQWDALNEAGICSSSTVHDRFQKWVAEGVFHRLKENGLLDSGATRGIDWSWLDEYAVEGAVARSGSAGRAQRLWQPRRRKPGALQGQYSKH